MAVNLSPQLQNLLVMVSGKFNEGRMAASADSPTISTTIASTSAQNLYPQMTQWPQFSEWTKAAQRPGFGDIDATSFAIVNKKFSAGVSISREDVEDDNYGLLAQNALGAGQATITHRDELVMPLLTAGFTGAGADGQVFFSANHAGPNGTKQSNVITGSAPSPWFLIDNTRPLMPFIFQPRTPYELIARFDPNSNDAAFNLDVFEWAIRVRCNAGFGAWETIVGAQTGLDAAGYAEARRMLASVMSPEGRPMRTQGKLLVVGPSNEAAAREAVLAQRNAAGADNVWAGTAQILVTPYLP
ncbi:Mu-like prophage major head subunit gpT [Burkholderia sp. YR290]|nr:Mu-like prophage major head subunit gpT [Burkholderia sp. YR290]